MAYFTEAELEGLTGKAFTATSLVTTTQITALAQEISNTFDALMQQTVGSETPDEFVTQACLAAAVYTIGQIYAGEPVDPIEQAKKLKYYMTPIKGVNTSYSQEQPDSTGEW